jgi:hypothetical protein
VIIDYSTRPEKPKKPASCTPWKSEARFSSYTWEKLDLDVGLLAVAAAGGVVTLQCLQDLVQFRRADEHFQMLETMEAQDTQAKRQ